MLDVVPAKRKLLDLQSIGRPQLVPLHQAHGLVLAQAVPAEISLPRFDQSAMDGYACRASDGASAGSRLRIVGEDWAGKQESTTVTAGTCVRIMTGAKLSPGADAVVMKEYCRIDGDCIVIERPVQVHENVRFAGEEIKAGQSVLRPGMYLRAGVIGLLSSLGVQHVWAYSRAKIAIIATGSELVKPGNALKETQIYESNSVTLQCALRETGAEIVMNVLVADDPIAIRAALDEALQKSTHVILCGGVSVGEHDHNKRILAEAGVREMFWKIAQKPGKPFYFGKLRDVSVFGLPGNPVSTLVCYYEYVRATILKYQNRFGDADQLPEPVEGFDAEILAEEQKKYFMPSVPAFLNGSLRKKAGLTHFVRARVTTEGRVLRVEPVSEQGSHMMSAFAEANCLLVFPKHAERLEEGCLVNVHVFPGEVVHDREAVFFW